MNYVLPLEEASLDRVEEVGGKNASLGEMLRSMKSAGVRVPGGFALTSAAYRHHLEENGLTERIHASLDGLDVDDVRALSEIAADLRQHISQAPLPADVAREASKAYEKLSLRFADSSTDVAVRSSATAEDLPTASFAGQLESFLNIRGWGALDQAIRNCMASLFTDRAIAYRIHNEIPLRDLAVSVCVQKMIRSDLACSGVMFTLDTESGSRDVVLINAAYGLGEFVVQGRVNPDEYWVHKPTLRKGFRPIFRRELGAKERRLVYSEDNGRCVEEKVSPECRDQFALSDDEVLELAQFGVAIEEHYSRQAGQPVPMDIEWGKDGRTGEIFVLQARPETVHAQVKSKKLELFRLGTTPQPLVRGRSVGNRIGSGRVSMIASKDDLADFESGSVLVTKMTDPDWEPVLKSAAAVVTERGGRTCHAAIVSREHGIPCVVGTENATRVLHSGMEVTVSCAGGDEGRVYAGTIPYEREEVDPAALPEPPVPLMLNLANPDVAFQAAQLPCAGVGLMRVEFLVSSRIGVHPMALLSEEMKDSAEWVAIEKLTAPYDEPSDYFVDRLASGIAQVAAAFYPRPVLVRFSDFKTNEYADLLGGKHFEPEEANPMIGFRGASRYCDPRYRKGFGLECQAVRRARETMGFGNIKTMIPFCRTLAEAEAVQAEMKLHGLERGKNGLEVWVMCEVPNNAVLAEEFSALFDGVSIGSNDLTQLMLGIDRDSELLAHVFDEHDPGVKADDCDRDLRRSPVREAGRYLWAGAERLPRLCCVPDRSGN